MTNEDKVEVTPETIKLEWHYLGELKELKSGDKSPFTFDTEGKKIKPFPGIYVWIWKGEKRKYVHYVGQAQDIWKRLEDEVSALLGGAWMQYKLEPNSDLYEIKKKISLGGLKTGNFYCGVRNEHYSPNRGKQDSISAMMDEKRIGWAWNMLDKMDVAVAKIEDKERRLNVEAALIHGLRKHLREKLNVTVKGLIENVFFGRVTKEPTEVFDICHAGDFKQLPAELIEIKKCGQ